MLVTTSGRYYRKETAMDELLTELPKFGLLGVLLAISLSLNWFLIKLILSEKDKRIEAAEKVRDELITPIGFIQESLKLIDSKITLSKEAQR